MSKFHPISLDIFYKFPMTETCAISLSTSDVAVVVVRYEVTSYCTIAIVVVFS